MRHDIGSPTMYAVKHVTNGKDFTKYTEADSYERGSWESRVGRERANRVSGMHPGSLKTGFRAMFPMQHKEMPRKNMCIYGCEAVLEYM